MSRSSQGYHLHIRLVSGISLHLAEAGRGGWWRTLWGVWSFMLLFTADFSHPSSRQHKGEGNTAWELYNHPSDQEKIYIIRLVLIAYCSAWIDVFQCISRPFIFSLPCGPQGQWPLLLQMKYQPMSARARGDKLVRRQGVNISIAHLCLLGCWS